MCLSHDSKGGKFLQTAMNVTGNILAEARKKLVDTCVEKAALSCTRYETYLTMNPMLDVHEVYLRRGCNSMGFNSMHVVEAHRVAFTRFRLSSHDLKIETGRWSRLQRENRLCPCGSIQTEFHVLFECNRSEEIRSQFPNCFRQRSLDAFLNQADTHDIVKIVYMLLKLF